MIMTTFITKRQELNLNSLLERRVTSGWAAETMQELLVFLILGVGRLREDQFIYVETREMLCIRLSVNVTLC